MPLRTSLAAVVPRGRCCALAFVGFNEDSWMGGSLVSVLEERVGVMLPRALTDEVNRLKRLFEDDMGVLSDILVCVLQSS